VSKTYNINMKNILLFISGDQVQRFNSKDEMLDAFQDYFDEAPGERQAMAEDIDWALEHPGEQTTPIDGDSISCIVV
jgi:hypothetical protein